MKSYTAHLSRLPGLLVVGLALSAIGVAGASVARGDASQGDPHFLRDSVAVAHDDHEESSGPPWTNDDLQVALKRADPEATGNVWVCANADDPGITVVTVKKVTKLKLDPDVPAPTSAEKREAADPCSGKQMVVGKP